MQDSSSLTDVKDTAVDTSYIDHVPQQKELHMTNRNIEKAAQLAPIVERVHGLITHVKYAGYRG